MLHRVLHAQYPLGSQYSRERAQERQDQPLLHKQPPHHPWPPAYCLQQSDLLLPFPHLEQQQISHAQEREQHRQHAPGDLWNRRLQQHEIPQKRARQGLAQCEYATKHHDQQDGRKEKAHDRNQGAWARACQVA